MEALSMFRFTFAIGLSTNLAHRGCIVQEVFVRVVNQTAKREEKKAHGVRS